MKLSVVIPAYNEEKRIPKTLEAISGYLTKQNYDYEIIVVNDGSKDGTAEIVRKLMAKIKNLRLIDNKENNGKGYVVEQGLMEAKGDYRIFTDSDNSTPIEQVEKMWPEFEKGYDIVIGSRHIKGAVLDPPQPWYRRILGYIFNFVFKIIIGLWRIQDSQCGFKGFSKKAVEEIIPKCTIKGFSFDPEILVIAKKMGFKIKEIPVLWKNNLHSKVKFKHMVNMGLDLLRIRWNLIAGKYKPYKH